MWKLNITNLLVALLSLAAMLASVYIAIYAEYYTSAYRVRCDNLLMAFMFFRWRYARCQR